MGAKLIRDRMGNIPWLDEDQKKYLRPIKDRNEHYQLLWAKFFEELGELLTSEMEDAVREFADLYEVLDTLVFLFEEDGKVKPGDIARVQSEKSQARGGFRQGLVFDCKHESTDH